MSLCMYVGITHIPHLCCVSETVLYLIGESNIAQVIERLRLLAGWIRSHILTLFDTSTKYIN